MTKRCGTKYKHIIGYGPMCPDEWIRLQKMRDFPSHCPKCSPTDYSCLNFTKSRVKDARTLDPCNAVQIRVGQGRKRHCYGRYYLTRAWTHAEHADYIHSS